MPGLLLAARLLHVLGRVLVGGDGHLHVEVFVFVVAGADIQYAVISNLQLLAEVFRDQPGPGKYQVGARYIIVPNCVEAYASYANRLNKSSERSVVIGIRVQTAAILP